MAGSSSAGRWRPLVAFLAVGVAVDQIAKQLADAFLRGRGLVSVVDGIFELRYTRNPGAFFSLGASLDPVVRRSFFVLASLLAIGLIVRLYLRTADAARLMRAALALLLAGAIGNLVDRLVYGEVIDFVHLYWRGRFDWATFNVADVYIVGGLLLLAMDAVRPRREPNGSMTKEAEGSA